LGIQFHPVKEKNNGNPIIGKVIEWYRAVSSSPFRKKVSQKNTKDQQEKKGIDTRFGQGIHDI
jgi:hypothetical protein